MKCKEAKTKLHFWVDNQLHKNEDQDLIQHLSSCSSCSNFKNELLMYKNLIFNQDNLMPCKIDPITMDSESVKKHKKIMEMISLAAAACFGILIGMSLFQLSVFNSKNRESVIAETTPATEMQNIQNVNIMQETYYMPMSFMVNYDNFFFIDKSIQPQKYSIPSE